MTSYCVECGTASAGGNFCSGCGRSVTAAVGTMALPTVGAPGDPTSDPNPHRKHRATRRRWRTAVAVGAVGLSVVALSAFAISSQAQTAADEQAAAEQAEKDAKAKAAAEAKAEKKRIEAEAEKIAAKKVEEERQQMQAEQNAAQAQQQQDAADAAAAAAAASESDSSGVQGSEDGYYSSVDGSWSGSMDGGSYSFSMELSESGGSISGSMYQQDSSSGADGTEYLTGYREGDTLYLRGTSWSGAPANWGLDSIVVTLSGDGDSFSGSYGCDSCSGTKSIYGSR